MSREFVVTPEAVDQGRRLGVGEDVATRVARMARRAAPVTHPQGNRRFEEWVLRIEKGVVLSIAKMPALQNDRAEAAVADVARAKRRRQQQQQQPRNVSYIPGYSR